MRVHAHDLLRNTNAYRRSFSDSQVLQEIQNMITPILLCGGSGTRLWPLSRKSFPKQFADILGNQSLFQASAARFRGPGFAGRVIIIASHGARHARTLDKPKGLLHTTIWQDGQGRCDRSVLRERQT